MSAPHDRSSGKEIVPSWLQNHSFSGNLSALFAQLAESSSATTDIHSISIDKDTDVVGVPVRASAMDYFDSSEDEYEDNDDFVSTNNPYPPSSSLVESHNVKEISDRNMDEYVWVEKTDTSSKLSGKKRKRKYNDDKKSRKKRKINDKSDDNYVNKKEAKRKLKEKEKILELEERVRKEYGAMKRASTYQWGSIIKDASSGEYMTVKENPLKTDNELYYWDTKPDKDLLLYERIYSNLVPSYYHAPKRCLGLKKNEIARFLKQHQTYLITSINNLSNSSLRYYSRPIKRTGTISIKPQKNNSNNYMEENDFISLDLDNNSVNNTEIEEESFEDYIMKKTHLFNEETQKNPNNIDIWLSFISFQDEIYNSRGISISKKAIIEKKMAIYLSALQKNPDSEKLLIGYLQCCNELWDMEKLLSLWENVMSAKKNSPTMWEHYISFRLTHFTSFSVSEIRKLFNRALKEMYILQKISINRGDLESSIKAETSIVEFFRRLCLFEAQSGYMERAVALYQAIIEFNCEYPSNVEEFDSRLKVFEAFWDSEAPRIGEESSKGWSIWCNTMDNNKEEMIYCTKNTKYEEDVQTLLNKLNNLDNMEDDEYSFSKKLMEENLFHPFWRPKRSGDHENSLDMEQVILFTDIEDYIYPIRILGLKIQLIQNFIEFLLSSYGGNLSILLHLSDDIRSNLYFESDTLGYDLCEYLPQHEDVVANQLAPSTTIEQEYNSILPKEYSLFDCNTSNEDSLLSDDIALFIKRVLEQSLNWFPNNSELSQLYLKFELYYHRTESRHTIKQRSSAMKNTCKMLLSKRSEDLELWKSYAKAEQVLGRYEEAKRILDTALSMSKLQNTSISLVKEYAKLELYYPTINHSKITLARVLSILMSLTESKFESIIVKRKELSKLSIDENFNDLNSLSKTILPRITPVRVLQCQSKLQSIRNTLKEKEAIEQSFYVDYMIIYLLFEYLNKGITQEMNLFSEIISLSWKNSKFKLMLYEQQIEILEYHRRDNIVPPKTFRSLIQEALHQYPGYPPFLESFLKHESRSQLQNGIRRFFDIFCNRQSSPIIWMFAIKFETKRIGTYNRIISLFERALENADLSRCSMIWRSYIQFHLHRNELEAAKRIFFRAIRIIPFSKSLWILCTKLGLSPEETTEILNLMIEKEIRLRINIDCLIFMQQVDCSLRIK